MRGPDSAIYQDDQDQRQDQGQDWYRKENEGPPRTRECVESKGGQTHRAGVCRNTEDPADNGSRPASREHVSSLYSMRHSNNGAQYLYLSLGGFGDYLDQCAIVLV